jgi:hypothetical protein
MLAIAGRAIAETAPWITDSTISDHNSAVPVSTSNAIRPWARAEVMLENCKTSVRGKRSEITPPHSSSTIIGIVCAASTCPRADAESVTSRTAKANAMLAIMLPSVLTNRDPKYQAKLRSRSGASDARQVTAPPPVATRSEPSGMPATRR